MRALAGCLFHPAVLLFLGGVILLASIPTRLLIWKARKKPAPAPNTEEPEEGK